MCGSGCPRTSRVVEARAYSAWEHPTRLHLRGVACSQQQDFSMRTRTTNVVMLSAGGGFLPLGRPDPTGLAALLWIPVHLSLICKHFRKRGWGTREGEKQNRKTVRQSRNRNRSLRNHYGNGEVTYPEKTKDETAPNPKKLDIHL